MERVRLRGGPWSSVQDIGAPADAVTTAWMESGDPFAMLLLLAALHPGHDEPVCDALVASMSFFAPMREEQRQQARSRPGMNYNGPDRFRFLHLAQRIRSALSAMDPTERIEIEVKLGTAIRTVVGNPYAVSIGADVTLPAQDPSQEL